MNHKSDNTPHSDLQFLGQISASISHELKNVLAIINENAGLLEDLTLMAERGVPLDPDRLNAMANGIKKQVGRADTIIGNMNRFAHSADQTMDTIDLTQTVELAMAVTARFAAMKGVTIDLQLPEHPVTMQTAPFYLINLIWLCLEFAMSAAGAEKRIGVAVEAAQNSTRIRFGGLGGLNAALLENFPSDRAWNLLGILEAEWTVNEGCGDLILQLRS